ncbi:hypothetical protein GCM10022420_060100 [Streptomyces iranensis]
MKQRPCGDSPPNLAAPRVVSARMLRFTPPAMAVEDSPRRRLSQARCTATSEDDWAVSTVMLGPRSPSVCETRLAMTPRPVPAIVCWSIASVPARSSTVA